MPKKRDVRKMLVEDGWYKLLGKATGHEQYKYPTKPGKVTLSGKDSADMPLRTWNDVKRQAGWK